MSLELKKEWRHHGGWLRQYTHKSDAVGGLTMKFSVFLPPQADTGSVPALYYLAGLTCSDEQGAQKGGFTKAAAARGIAIVFPDTSPRGANFDGEDESYDFGSGAGFYLDATAEPWSRNYRMYTYITEELPAVIKQGGLPIRTTGKSAIFGHSMGGHGALTLAFKNPDKYCSVSAFAPICNPVNSPWGMKALPRYLGSDESTYKEYDATELVLKHGPFSSFERVLIDQGTGDEFYISKQLRPEILQDACKQKGQALDLRLHADYDHSYFFISTFAEEHVNLHADALLKE